MSFLRPCMLVVMFAVSCHAAGCHGNSRFRLAPVSSSERGGEVSTKEFQSEFSLEQKIQRCREEYGTDALMMDLALLEGEFQNAADMQHALNPLFEKDPNSVYFVTDHGKDEEQPGIRVVENGKFVLVKEDDETVESSPGVRQRVAGQVFLETRVDASEGQILCYIPKPKYESSGDGMNMDMTMTTRSSAMMAMEESEASSSGSSSWFVTFLSMVTVGAIGVAAYQTYKAKSAAQGASSYMQPSLDLGGSYSILSSGDMTESLAPASNNNGVELA